MPTKPFTTALCVVFTLAMTVDIGAQVVKGPKVALASTDNKFLQAYASVGASESRTVCETTSLPYLSNWILD